MLVHPDSKKMDLFRSIDITDEDICEAMKEIPGYLDITTSDFKEVCRHAHKWLAASLAVATSIAVMLPARKSGAEWA